MTTNFSINITGKPATMTGYDQLVTQLEKRIGIFAPEAVINVYNFAKLNKRLEITGIIKKMENIDNFVKSMKLYLNKNLRSWEYKVSVLYSESSL